MGPAGAAAAAEPAVAAGGALTGAGDVGFGSTGGGGGGCGGACAELEETDGQHAQIAEPAARVRVVDEVEHGAELVFGCRPLLAIVGSLRRLIVGGGDLGQQALANVGERCADAWRLRLARAIRRVGGDDGGDCRLGLGRPAEREQAERTILLDRLAVHRLADAQAVQHAQRFVVSRRRIQVLGSIQRSLRRGAVELRGRREGHPHHQHERRKTDSLHDLPLCLPSCPHVLLHRDAEPYGRRGRHRDRMLLLAELRMAEDDLVGTDGNRQVANRRLADAAAIQPHFSPG